MYSEAEREQNSRRKAKGPRSLRTLHTCPSAPPPRPAPSIQIVPGPPTLARALLASTFATFQRTQTDWKVEGGSRSQAVATRPEQPQVFVGWGSTAGLRPFTGAVVIGSSLRHSAFRGGGRRRGSGGKGRGRGGGRAARSRQGRESQVQRTRGLGARSRHAGESLRRRGGRCRDTGLLQELRPTPAAALAAFSGPRASGVPAH